MLHSVELGSRNTFARATIVARPNVSARLGSLQWIQASLLVLVAGIGLAAKTGILDADELDHSASLLLSAVVAWNFCSWRLAGRVWFEPYSLFLLAATLFNGGQALLEVFYLNHQGILAGEFSSGLIVAALYMVALALAAFHFGALIGLARAARPVAPANPGVANAHLEAARLVGFACMAISVVPMILVLRDTLTTALDYGYSGLYGRSDALSSTLQVIAAFMIPGVMYLTAGSRNRRIPVLIAAVFVLAYAGVMFVAGSRGPATMILISYAWLFHHTVAPWPRVVLAGLGIVMLLTLPLVAALRTTPALWQDPSRLFTEVFAAQTNPLIAPVSEMGSSLVAVVQTVRLVPSVRPFDYGTSYAYAVSTILPNVGWEIHPATAHGLLGDWLIKMVNPYIASRGGGLGYSFIAEAFANFGWYGVAPLLACLGYLLLPLFRWGTDTTDPIRCAFLGTFLSFFLLFARGESGTSLRSLVWYSLMPYVAITLIGRRTVRRVGVCRLTSRAAVSGRVVMPTRERRNLDDCTRTQVRAARETV